MFYALSHTNILTRCSRPIRGAFLDNLPGFSGFLFCTKLARIKTQQGTQTKKSNIRGVHYFLGIWSCLCVHQQEWCQLLLMVYPLYILFPHNLCQLPFSPSTLPEYAAIILNYVSVPLGGALLPLPQPPIPYMIRFLFLTFLSRRQKRSHCSDPTVAVPLGLGQRCKFLIPPSYPFFPTFPLYMVLL